MLITMIIMTVLYHIEVLLMIRPTGTHSHAYTHAETDILTHIHMRAHEHAHIHILTLSACVHTLSFKLINMMGTYTHTMYSRKTAIY